MAITMNGETLYQGAVLGEHEHMWMDGMLEVHTIVWDMENHEEKWIQTGYYGSDGCNLCEHVDVEFEISQEVARDILRTMKRRAWQALASSVTAQKEKIDKGIQAEVIKGRKVPKGTILDVFWVGERPTYRSRQYSWMNETETIAGCYDKDGNKVWIKAEYLKNISPIKSPVAAERDKFIKAYVKKNTSDAVRKVARGRRTA